jgi:secretion/DNA translocation related TadE-like protein
VTQRSVRDGHDRGSAGLLAVWAAVLVVLAAVLAVGWGGVVLARHRAGSIADLAALAAARSAGLGAAEPCSAAAEVATAGGARLEACGLLPDGSTGVVVAVGGPVLGGPWGWLHTGPARARARAGIPP